MTRLQLPKLSPEFSRQALRHTDAHRHDGFLHAVSVGGERREGYPDDAVDFDQFGYQVREQRERPQVEDSGESVWSFLEASLSDRERHFKPLDWRGHRRAIDDFNRSAERARRC